MTMMTVSKPIRNIAIAIALMMFGLFVAMVTAQTQPTSGPAAKDLTLDLADGVSLKLVRIPAGKFLMGSPETEKDRQKDEVQHEVTISKPFYMGMTHVTVDQFAAFVKDSGYKTDGEKDANAIPLKIIDGKLEGGKVGVVSWRNPGFEQKSDHPVVRISWNDAQAFCAWLSKKTGKTVTLPTEAQWEYACRAGTTTAYPWGDNPDDGKGWANLADQSLQKMLPNAPADWKFFAWDDGFVFTAPVASFKPNAFGLYDMIGNAWQWCQDKYGAYKPEAVTDPAGSTDPTNWNRVLRGGSWDDFPGDCRSAFRHRYNPGNHSMRGGFGFRVVVTSED